MAKRPRSRPVDTDLTPMAEADDQMHMRDKPTKRAPKKSMRPRLRPEDVSPSAEADDQMHVQNYRSGGMVRGKKFSGTY